MSMILPSKSGGGESVELKKLQWTSSGNATVTKTLDFEPKYLLIGFDGQGGSVTVYDIQNNAYRNSIGYYRYTLNGTSVSVYCPHTSFQTDNLYYI